MTDHQLSIWDRFEQIYDLIDNMRVYGRDPKELVWDIETELDAIRAQIRALDNVRPPR